MSQLSPCRYLAYMYEEHRTYHLSALMPRCLLSLLHGYMGPLRLLRAKTMRNARRFAALRTMLCRFLAGLASSGPGIRFAYTWAQAVQEALLPSSI